MPDNLVKLTIEASGGQSAKVVARDFFRQSDALINALAEVAKTTQGGATPEVRYRIASLSANSPAVATYEAETLDFAPTVNFDRFHKAFDKSIKAVATAAEMPGYVTASLLKYLKELVAPIGATVHTARIEIAGSETLLDLKFRQRLASIAAKDRIERGMFIKGTVEAMNIHGETHRLTLYPHRGPEKVVCIFEKDLKLKAIESFGKFVRVHGDFKYEWRAVHPYEIKVSDIEFLKPVAEIPKITSLMGIAPNATGGLSAEEFVEGLRHG